VKSPTRKRKGSVRKSRKKISGNRRTRKSWNGKGLTKAAKKGMGIDESWIRKSVNGKEDGGKGPRSVKVKTNGKIPPKNRIVKRNLLQLPQVPQR